MSSRAGPSSPESTVRSSAVGPVDRRAGVEPGPAHTVDVSVVVLTYNNPAIAANCIESCLAQDHPSMEILVVDNASTDDTRESLSERFPTATILTRSENSPVAARNQGFRAASGRYVLSLDHDMVLRDPGFVRRAVEIAQTFPKAGAIIPKICGENTGEVPIAGHWWHQRPIADSDQYFYTRFFPEGAVLFRAEALQATDGYDERFFHVEEAVDLSFRLYRMGWRVLYCPDLTTIELVVSGHVSRRRAKANEYSLRNRLWVAWKYYTPWRAVRYAVPRIGVDAIRSIRFRWFDYFLAGLRHGVFAPADIRRDRNPMSPDFWLELENIESLKLAANR